ncbi:hypothetical protein P3T23_002863 [Paraburkholderia sp. GAS448]|uniref:hypothetical protein n=1 Tax=Paraburkholderia sp. GAS448 TaxID=3035136 RepID=UPI003D20858E
MTTNAPPNAPSPAPKPADTGVKPLSFAFPFLRKGSGTASAQFTDEHDLYRLLAERESGGSYLVSRAGMWHGGIHITEAGAGQALDLDLGVRCIADGHVIAYRINQANPVSDVSASGNAPLDPAPYSTGFALVRHSMEFPKGTTLTFYSLYMHLQAYDEYTDDPKRKRPAYWSTQFQITGFAQDTPTPGKNGQVASADRQGLNVHRSPHPGHVIGILPQGASVSIGPREKGWGRITDLHGSSLYPPVAGGFVASSAAVGGWIYLGNENGKPLVNEVMPDASFDRVVITVDGPQGAGILVKAGDLIGHLGRYDSLNQHTAGTRMVHIEVFCDDSIKTFIEEGRAWVEEHGPHPKDWAALGLPADPTILRIAPKTTLYQREGTGGNRQALYNWAISQQAHNPNWKSPFSKLGQVQAFQEIQIDQATSKYHPSVLDCIDFLRSVSPDLMKKVELLTYCDLYDLCVQQGSLARAAQEIRTRVANDHPTAQRQLLRIAVEERAKKANPSSVADCMSRRIGIFQQSAFTYVAYGVTKTRQNPKFHIISKDASNYVCGL